jgi:hypothetical protein
VACGFPGQSNLRALATRTRDGRRERGSERHLIPPRMAHRGWMTATHVVGMIGLFHIRGRMCPVRPTRDLETARKSKVLSTAIEAESDTRLLLPAAGAQGLCARIIPGPFNRCPLPSVLQQKVQKPIRIAEWRLTNEETYRPDSE